MRRFQYPPLKLPFKYKKIVVLLKCFKSLVVFPIHTKQIFNRFRQIWLKKLTVLLLVWVYTYTLYNSKQSCMLCKQLCLCVFTLSFSLFLSVSLPHTYTHTFSFWLLCWKIGKRERAHGSKSDSGLISEEIHF